MTHTVALIAVRMGSSRLPGKALMEVGGEPMLGLLIKRISDSKYIDRIVIATTDRKEDAALRDFAEEIGVDCFRGSSDDVLGRITRAARHFEAERVLQLLGDNPLLDAALADAVMGCFLENDCEYAVNATDEFPFAPKELNRFAIGVRAEVMTMDALLRCEKAARDEHFREHATSYIAHHPDQFRMGYLPAVGEWEVMNRPEWTFAVNYQRNLDLIRELFARAGPESRQLTLGSVASILEREPELLALMGPPQEQ